MNTVCIKLQKIYRKQESQNASQKCLHSHSTSLVIKALKKVNIKANNRTIPSLPVAIMDVVVSVVTVAIVSVDVDSAIVVSGSIVVLVDTDFAVSCFVNVFTIDIVADIGKLPIVDNIS